MVEIGAFYTGETSILDADRRATLESQLSPDYRRRLDRVRHDVDRSETLAGLALLERSFIAMGFPSPALSRLEYPPGGAPRLPDAPRFSLSHTQGLIVCVVASCAGVRVGVDVERLRSVAPRVLRHVLDPASLAIEGAQPSDVLAAWTAAEAALKAAEVSVRRIAELRLSEDRSSASFAAAALHLRPLVVPEGYVATVASDAARFRLRAAVAA